MSPGRCCFGREQYLRVGPFRTADPLTRFAAEAQYVPSYTRRKDGSTWQKMGS
jgi:hypothetical protein